MKDFGLMVMDMDYLGGQLSIDWLIFSLNINQLVFIFSHDLNYYRDKSMTHEIFYNFRKSGQKYFYSCLFKFLEIITVMKISWNKFCTDFIIFDYLKKNIEIKYSKKTETEWKNIFLNDNSLFTT